MSWVCRFCLVLCLGWSVVAQNPAPPVPAQQETVVASNQYGAISGRVLSDEGAVPFASVTASPASGRGRGNEVRTVTTDAEGNFKLDGLRAIAWRLTATAPGYVLEAAPSDGPTTAFHRIGDVVSVRLVKGGVITGRVLNANGEPLIAVRVSAQMIRDAQENPGASASIGGDFQTDDRGVYRLYGLAAGTYVVVASPSANGLNGGPNFRQSPYDGDVPVYFPSSTRDAASEVAVVAGSETGGIDIRYRSEKGRAVSGSVAGVAQDSSRPDGAAVSVLLTHAGSGTVFTRAFVVQRGRGAIPGNNRTATSGSNGFAVYGVPDGEYEITAVRNSADGVEAMSAPSRVAVSGRDVTGLSLVLKPLATITARLQVEPGKRCEAQRKPSFEEQLFAVRAEELKEPRLLPNGPRPAAADRTGELLFRELTAGQYRLLPQLLDDGWFLRSITAPVTAPATRTAVRAPVKPSLQDVGRNGLVLKSGERLSGVTITVAEGAASLSGKIKAAEGGSLPSQYVLYLVPAERESAEDALRYAEVRPGSEGVFRLANLAPGKYWLLTRALPKGDAKPKAWNAAERAKLRKDAEVANQALELATCQRLANYEIVFKP